MRTRSTLYSILATLLWILLIAFVSKAHAASLTKAQLFDLRLNGGAVTIPLYGTNAETRRPSEQWQIACIADAVYHEARGEPIRGMEAVAHVVKNRVYAGFGPTPCAVVHARGQFDFIALGLSEVREPKLYAASLFIAEKVWQGRLQDFTGGALYFYAPKKAHPTWAKRMQVAVKIGEHIFLRSDHED